MKTLDFMPVIIIGAPRSGTNMLRDVLCSISQVATWPCDEINYIWRHGNVTHPSDELTPDKSRPAIKNYIRKEFGWVARKYNANIVIEKTCANALRIPFVSSVLPEAKYIYIYRDGMDVVGSARQRWTASLDIPYILQKVRFVPKIDLPYYCLRYLWARIFRIFSKDRRLGFWGPNLNNMSSILRNNSLNQVCAIQWQQCVEKAEATLSSIASQAVIRVKYEDFVREPKKELTRILAFIGKNVDEVEIQRATSKVSSDSIGKGRKLLGFEEMNRLKKLVGKTLKRYDY